MSGTPIRTIVATMIVGAAVSFPILWSRRAAQDVETPAETTAPRPGQPALPAADPPPAEPIAAQAPPKAPPLPDVPLADDASPPLPVMLSVSAHPGPPHGEDSQGSTPGMPTVARQVDVINESSQPLDLMVLVVDLPTQESTRAAWLLPANAEAHLGTESGLKIEPGDVVTLQSRGFRPLTQTVP